jgi:hypothetical protein
MPGALDVLVGLMPPHQGSGNEVDWAAAEAAYGCRFPADYRAFAAVYGEGSIDESISVMMPSGSGNLWEPVVSGAEPPGIESPAGLGAVTPERILLWGQTSQADVLGWYRDSEDPDRWPVVVWSRTTARWSRYECGMTEFLARLLRADFSECPISDLALWGAEDPTFLNFREETRRREAGLDPWTGEPDSYSDEDFD